ncbi:MAG: PAS domain S-box protein [Candidatus Omnitrophica bacterium]|nr:PAS domain S-box protein [Candidatus Omnitrophota bacterium]
MGGKDVGLSTAQSDNSLQVDFFRMAVDTLVFAAICFDEDARIVYVNQMACETLEYTAEELASLSVPDIYPDYSKKKCGQLYRRLKRTKKDGVESIQKTKSGRLISVEIQFVFLTVAGEEYLFAIARDISKQKKLEERLETEIIAAKSCLDAAGVIMVALDLSGRVSLINRRGCEILGFQEDEVLGKNWIQTFVSESYVSETKKSLDRVVDGIKDTPDSSSYIENSVRTSYGYEKKITWQNMVLKDKNGKMCGTLCSGIETAIRKEEGKLRNLECSYQNLIEQLPAVTYIAAFDETRTTIYMSPQIEYLLGIASEEFVSDPKMWQEYLHPDDRERVVEELRRSRRKGAAFDCEYRMVAKEGGEVWIRDCAIVVQDAQENAIYLRGVMVDIGERKTYESKLLESQGYLRFVLQQHPGILWTTDKEMKVSFCAGSELAGLGIQPDQAIGLGLTELLNIDDKHPIIEFHRRALKGVSVTYEYELFEKSYLGHTQPLYDSGESFIGVISVTFDITSEKSIVKALSDVELKYLQLYENCMDGIVFMDMDWSIRDCNNAYKEMLGYSLEELRQVTICGVTPERWHAGEMELLKEQILSNGQSGLFEKEHVRKNGTVLAVEMLVYLVRDTEGNPVGMFGLARDISARKESELALGDKNVALRELLSLVKEEKEELEKVILQNIDRLVFPILRKLKDRSTSIEKEYLVLLEDNLKHVTEPFGRLISEQILRLTPREIEICNLLRGGFTSKDIARLLVISVPTVEGYRNSIRKKLGITHGSNLSTYLQHLQPR